MEKGETRSKKGRKKKGKKRGNEEASEIGTGRKDAGEGSRGDIKERGRKKRIWSSME